jgi:tetratricopeptide (TPR) repeat protein
VTRPAVAVVHGEVGMALFRLGQMDEGILAFRKATALAPKAVWQHVNLGIALQGQGRLEEAMAEYRRAVELDPKGALALAHHRLGKAEEARRWLGKAQAWLDQYGDGMSSRAEEELGLHLHNWLEAHVLRREAEALLSAAPARGEQPGPATLPKR